jgi:hypothetical protein
MLRPREALLSVPWAREREEDMLHQIVAFRCGQWEREREEDMLHQIGAFLNVLLEREHAAKVLISYL